MIGSPNSHNSAAHFKAVADAGQQWLSAVTALPENVLKSLVSGKNSTTSAPEDSNEKKSSDDMTSESSAEASEFVELPLHPLMNPRSTPESTQGGFKTGRWLSGKEPGVVKVMTKTLAANKAMKVFSESDGEGDEGDVEQRRKSGGEVRFLRGPDGIGKSYALFCSVVALAAQKDTWRVLYVPDAWKWTQGSPPPVNEVLKGSLSGALQTPLKSTSKAALLNGSPKTPSTTSTVTETSNGSGSGIDDESVDEAPSIARFVEKLNKLGGDEGGLAALATAAVIAFAGDDDAPAFPVKGMNGPDGVDPVVTWLLTDLPTWCLQRGLKIAVAVDHALPSNQAATLTWNAATVDGWVNLLSSKAQGSSAMSPAPLSPSSRAWADPATPGPKTPGPNSAQTPGSPFTPEAPHPPPLHVVAPGAVAPPTPAAPATPMSPQSEAIRLARSRSDVLSMTSRVTEAGLNAIRADNDNRIRQLRQMKRNTMRDMMDKMAAEEALMFEDFDEDVEGMPVRQGAEEEEVKVPDEPAKKEESPHDDVVTDIDDLLASIDKELAELTSKEARGSGIVTTLVVVQDPNWVAPGAVANRKRRIELTETWTEEECKLWINGQPESMKASASLLEECRRLSGGVPGELNSLVRIALPESNVQGWVNERVKNIASAHYKWLTDSATSREKIVAASVGVGYAILGMTAPSTISTAIDRRYTVVDQSPPSNNRSPLMRVLCPLMEAALLQVHEPDLRNALQGIAKSASGSHQFQYLSDSAVYGMY